MDKISRRILDINYTREWNTQIGIAVEPTTVNAYRQMYKLLKTEVIQFHTFEFKSEKLLKVVVRGLPNELKEEAIAEDLKNQSYPVTKIARMKGKRGPFPIVIIERAKKYKSIFNLTICCYLKVETESLR